MTVASVLAWQVEGEEGDGLMDQQTFEDSAAGAVLFEAGATDDLFDVSTNDDPFTEVADTEVVVDTGYTFISTCIIIVFF